MNAIKRVMIDLETASAEKNAAILSIGAIEFGLPPGVPQRSFYEKATILGQSAHFDVSKSTMEWWDKQDKAVREEAFSGTKPLIDILNEFAKWMDTLSDDLSMDEIEIWSNGADFDCVVLPNAYYELQGSYPFNFRMHRCYRTLKALVPYEYGFLVRSESQAKHNALADVQYQAMIADQILRDIVVTPRS